MLVLTPIGINLKKTLPTLTPPPALPHLGDRIVRKRRDSRGQILREIHVGEVDLEIRGQVRRDALQRRVPQEAGEGGGAGCHCAGVGGRGEVVEGWREEGEGGEGGLCTPRRVVRVVDFPTFRLGVAF